MRLRDNPTFLVPFAAVFFTGMSACVKAVAVHVPLYETVFVRCLISAVILGGMLRQRGVSFRARNLPLLLTRSFSGFLAMSCNFYALGHLSLGDTAMLVNTFPLFVVLLSFIFLGERPSRKLFVWIALAMIGIGLVLHPQLDFLNYAGFIALLAAVLSAVVVVVIHQAHATDPSLRIAFYFTASAALFSVPMMMMQHLVTPTPTDSILLLGSGLFGTGGQLVMTRAYKFENVSRSTPLAYVAVVLSFIVGIIFWKEIPTLWSLIGSLIVIGACVKIALLKKAPPIA